MWFQRGTRISTPVGRSGRHGRRRRRTLLLLLLLVEFTLVVEASTTESGITRNTSSTWVLVLLIDTNDVIFMLSEIGDTRVQSKLQVGGQNRGFGGLSLLFFIARKLVPRNPWNMWRTCPGGRPVPVYRSIGALVG